MEEEGLNPQGRFLLPPPPVEIVAFPLDKITSLPPAPVFLVIGTSNKSPASHFTSEGTGTQKTLVASFSVFSRAESCEETDDFPQ